MAKKTHDRLEYTGDKDIRQENISERNRGNMQLFAKNTNIMRQLPRLEDGLKTGERRVLYAMYLLSLSAKSSDKTKPPKKLEKCARIVGDTMGKFHPHGDASTYGTLARLAQPWESFNPLIDGHGNFGSQSGDSPAAMRYTEARLSLYAWKCFFEDFNIKHAETRLNYLGQEPEPVFLPARYPNILGNGSQFGIGIGTNVVIPHFNFTEVMMTTMGLMDDPNFPFLLLPDSPTGADILSDGEFKEINETGNGKFRMRSRIDIDEEHHQLIIQSLPVQTTYDTFKNKLLEANDKKKLSGFVDVLDDSDDTKHGIRIHVVFKKEVDLYKVRHQIFKTMGLDKTIGVKIRAVDDYREGDYSVREALLAWIELRREGRRMKYNNVILDLREREHVLNEMMRVFDGANAEKALKTIRKSKNRAEMIDFLMNDFGVSSLQARNIANMTMATFTMEGIGRLRDELVQVVKDIKKYDKIIRSPKKIDDIIKQELEEGIALFGGPRKSEIVSNEGQIAVRDTEHMIVLTNNNMIKKLPHDAKTIGNIAEGDIPTEIIRMHNVEDLMIFDSMGGVHTLPISDVMNTITTTVGENLSKYIQIEGRVCGVMKKPKEEDMDDKYLMFISKKGLIKKTALNKFTGKRLLGMILKDNDQLQHVKLVQPNQEIVIYTESGFGARINSEDVRESNRMSVGVKSLDIKDDIIGMDVMRPEDKFIFILTGKGFAKKCTLETFPVIERNTKPFRIVTLATGDYISKVTPVGGNETYRVFLTDDTKDLSVEEVEELPRLSRGKKSVPVRKGVHIIDIKELKV